MTTAILGLGHYLPPQVERLGVLRPIAVDPGGPSVLGAMAAPAALAGAGLTAHDLDFIIFATMTPDVTFPGSGCYFQDRMECDTIGALDLRAQCAGFVFGLVIADRFIRSGTYRHIILVGAEVHSAGLDYSDGGAGIARLYGDGAGVTVLGAARNDVAGLRAAAIHSDGREHRRFWCEFPASRQHPVRVSIDNFRQGLHFPKVDFEAVREFGERSLLGVIEEVLTAAGIGAERVDRFVIGHLLPEVAESVGRRLGVPPSRLNVPAAKHGHLTAAALPVALSEEVASGSLDAGATVCLAASGAGYCWGAAVVAL
jgi:3-oxoacyl-[acyl-carrier-protein] synthase-3